MFGELCLVAFWLRAPAGRGSPHFITLSPNSLMMDKYLRPKRFDTDPNIQNADREWLHWRQTFENFLAAINDLEPNKLVILANYVSPEVYGYISHCTTYEDAITTLQVMYVKPKNEVFARYLLATRRQDSAESLDQFVMELKQLAKGCNFKAVTAETHLSVV